MLYVLCYDITSDRVRAKVADLLDGEMVRVQRSVYEGRMAARSIEGLAKRVWLMMEPEDSLRVYAISSFGLRRSLAFGPQPLPEANDFYLV